MVFSELQSRPDFAGSKEQAEINAFAQAAKKFEKSFDKADAQGDQDMNVWAKREGMKLVNELSESHPMRKDLAMAAGTGRMSDVLGVIKEIIGYYPSDQPGYESH